MPGRRGGAVALLAVVVAVWWSGLGWAVQLGPALVRLSAADAVVEPAERWAPPVVEGGKRYRSARKGQNCYLFVPRFWQGDRPEGLHVIKLEYRDTLAAPGVVRIYSGHGGTWGHRAIGNVGGSGDGKWKMATFVVPARLITVKDHDSACLMFSQLAADLPVGVVSVYRPPAGQETALRQMYYEELERRVWQDAARMGKGVPLPETVKLEPVSRQHRKLGFIPFVRSWLKEIYPDSIPAQEERGNRLRAVAAAGEPEPIMFGLRSLDRELTGVRVRCSDLLGSGGAKIPASALHVGVVEFAPIRWGAGSAARNWRVRAVRIWPQESFPGNRFAGKAEAGLIVPANTTVAFWLTIRTPAGAAGGLYRGTVEVTVGRKRFEFDLALQVLPFGLVANERWWIGQYISGQLDDRQCRDLAEHGINATSQWPGGYDMSFANGRWQFDFSRQDAYMRRLQAWGIRGPHVWFQGNDRRHRLDLEVCKLAGVELDSPEFFRRYVEVVEAIHRHARQVGWNRLIWCIFDEPGKGGRAQRRWLGDARALKQQMGEEVRLFCVVLSRGAQRARQFLPYADIFSCNGKVAELVQLARRHGKEVWSYGPLTQRTSALMARWSFGFGVWSSGVQGHYGWAYNWSAGVPMNDFDAGHMDWMVSYEDLDGKLIPTPAWEACREGSEDLRYVLTLESLLAAKRDLPRARQIAEELGRLRCELTGPEARLGSSSPNVLNLPFAPIDQDAMSRARRQIARWIVELRRP